MLSVDQGAVHRCEGDGVEEERAEEVERVEDQATRCESETWCARVAGNWWRKNTFRVTKYSWAARGKILRGARHGVLFTPSLRRESLLPVSELLLMHLPTLVIL